MSFAKIGATLFSKARSNKLRFSAVQNEMTLIDANFVADLFNIFKVTKKQTWPCFLPNELASEKLGSLTKIKKMVLALVLSRTGYAA